MKSTPKFGMNNETKEKIKQRYQHALHRGERFWPDSIFKDAIIALGIFVGLILLASFIGVPFEPKADPSDTSYIPRPEWYFLFLFKFLALYGQIPLLGKIEWLATVIVPSLAVLLLVLLPFMDSKPDRHYSKRVLPISIMGILVVSMVTLTMMSDVPTGATLVGTLQTIGGLVIPGLAYVLLLLMAFAFKNTSNKTMIWTAGISAALMVGLCVSVLALYQAPPVQAETLATTLVEQIQAGQQLYSVNCVECHGDDGKVVKIVGVKGLENKQIFAINSKDVLYTLNDAALAEVIAFGRPDAGMNPFGKAYNPQGLSRGEIDYVVTFMRYMWDDRFEKPTLKPLYPPLAAGEIPSYELQISPIVQRYCVSCHRPAKNNNSYLLDTYNNMLKTGDNSPNVAAGDMSSTLLQVIQGTPVDGAGTGEKINSMPPNQKLPADVVDVFKRWVAAGMPNSAADAKALPTAMPAPTATPKP